MSDELVAFLKTRIDEDEQIALALSLVWDPDGANHIGMYLGTGHMAEEEAMFIVHNNPRRELREVAAKRAIIAMYEDQAARAGENAEDESRAWLLLDVICHLTSAYADHPGYWSEWKP